jgi:hypothetical protein
VLDLQAGAAGAERRGLDALEVRRLEDLELALVGDGRDADAAVGRQLGSGRERVRRAAHDAVAAHLAQRRLHPPARDAVAQRARARDVDELVDAAVGPRRVRGEQVVRRLGLRVRQPEARDVARPDRLAERDGGDDRDDPGEERPEPVRHAPAREASEDRGLGLRNRWHVGVSAGAWGGPWEASNHEASLGRDV